VGQVPGLPARIAFFCAALLLTLPLAAAPNPRIGFYQWASSHGADLLTEARGRIEATGAGLMRIYLGARFDYVHPVLSRERFRELKTVTPAAILRLPRYRAMLEDPALATLVLTAYPSMDYGAGPDDISLLRPWGAEEEKQEYGQMFELAEMLLRDYGSLGKTVILANTEADDKLLEIMNYTGSPELAINNLCRWQNTRYRAILDARRRYPNARTKVLNAFEISLVNLKILRLHDHFVKHPQGTWNALADIVPKVRFDLLSYSSYESTNSPYETQNIDTPAAQTGVRLLRDLGKLREAVHTPVMIGELGVPYDRFAGLKTGGALPRLASALDALYKARPAYVVFWQVFDAPQEGRDAVEFGLHDPRRPPPPMLRPWIAAYR